MIQLNEINNLLEERYKNDTLTTLKELPKPNQFKDIQKATKRIQKAIENKETINIVGDYDADGIVSTTIMVEFFKNALGIDVNYIIPNRFEHGYGISAKILELIEDGLIITVDNGISAIEAANICKQRGLDLIITDHHTVGSEIPDAYAIVNPKREDCNFPFSDICGANVAWYLCANIKQAFELKYNLMELFDLLTIAVIADVMPMKSMNKAIVKKGLQELSNSKRISIVAIKQRLGLYEIKEDDIGFKIAPLINCAGRMADGKIALEFLLSKNSLEANDNLDYLIELNERRKKEQLFIFEDAKTQVNNDDEVIIVSSQDWNEGIIGIVASKLCEKYKKPAFVFSQKDGYFKGSGRSLGDIHLYELIDSVRELTINFGGHKGAAGLSVSVDLMPQFKEQINQNAKDITRYPFEYSETLCRLELGNVNNEIHDLITFYRPYGLENLLPIFRFENIKIEQVKRIGKNKEFKKLLLSDGIVYVDLLVFSDEDRFIEGENISFSASIEKNVFRDNVTYNLLFKELYI